MNFGNIEVGWPVVVIGFMKISARWGVGGEIDNRSLRFVFVIV